MSNYNNKDIRWYNCLGSMLLMLPILLILADIVYMSNLNSENTWILVFLFKYRYFIFNTILAVITLASILIIIKKYNHDFFIGDLKLNIGVVFFGVTLAKFSITGYGINDAFDIYIMIITSLFFISDGINSMLNIKSGILSEDTRYKDAIEKRVKNLFLFYLAVYCILLSVRWLVGKIWDKSGAVNNEIVRIIGDVLYFMNKNTTVSLFIILGIIAVIGALLAKISSKSFNNCLIFINKPIKNLNEDFEIKYNELNKKIQLINKDLMNMQLDNKKIIEKLISKECRKIIKDNKKNKEK